MYYLIATILLIAIELLYFRVAFRLHIVDRPNERSSHRKPVLLGAGILFYMAVLVWSLFHQVPYPRFLIAATLLAVVCYLDDLRDIPSWVRLLAQAGAVVLAFFTEISTLQVWQMVLVVVFFCCVLNVYNFMDGINGMLAAYSLVVVASFEWLNLQHQFVSHEFIVTVLAAIAVFGFFNCRNKARCFSGDVGSVVMGFIVLFLYIRYDVATPDNGENLSFLCLIMVYLIDGLLTIAKRFLTGKNILEAHREHLYETLVNDLHVPHLQVSVGYAVLQLLINAGYMLVPDHNLYTLLVAMVLIIAYGLFFFYCRKWRGIAH